MANEKRNSEQIQITPEEIQRLDGVMDAIKQMAIANISPELMRKKIAQIKASNTDSDKSKLSRDEAVAYLTANFADPPVDPNFAALPKVMKPQQIKACELAGIDSAIGKEVKTALDTIGAKALQAIQLPQGISYAIEHGDKRLDSAIKKYAENMSAELIANVSKSMDINDATKKVISTKFQALAEEVAATNRVVLEKNPNIRRDFLALPEMSELGKLKADDTCKAMTGKGTGKSV